MNIGSHGMLLFGTDIQIFIRRRNEEQLLVGWAIPQLHSIDALLKMLDPSLDEECHAKSLSHFADIISRCVRSGEFFLTLV